MDIAARLITAMHPEDEKARAAALAKMEEVAAEFRKEEETFSDIYVTFQEERHTAMTREEQNRFSWIYYKQEALAVGKLVHYAQKHLTKGEYAQALKYLDATLFSELRVRTAQLMKVECLRALGRHAEAERLARETLAAWPEMGTARRLFRFLGMVVNEGKSLLVGLTGKGKRDPERKLAG